MKKKLIIKFSSPISSSTKNEFKYVLKSAGERTINDLSSKLVSENEIGNADSIESFSYRGKALEKTQIDYTLHGGSFTITNVYTQPRSTVEPTNFWEIEVLIDGKKIREPLGVVAMEIQENSH